MGGALSSVAHQDGMQVVVVGGGYGGAYLTVLLRKKNLCKVTLIDPKDCMIHCVAALRASVEAGYARNVFVPYDEMVGDSFVRGKVVKLDTLNKTVILESGVKICYTHLVIATGTTSPFPGKIVGSNPSVSKEDGIAMYEEFRKNIETSNNVVCVGGGAVGVELAAEIRTTYPNKAVTLIHSSRTLASERLKPDVQESLHSGLQELGVTLLLNERVVNLTQLTLSKYSKGQVVKTESGKGIVADLVVTCVGNKVNTDFCKDSLDSSMTEQGQLRVDNFFRVAEQSDLYAIGDVTDIDEEKMCYVAKQHADLLVDNWVAELSGKEKKPYQKGSFVMLVPLGKNGGAGEFKGFSLGSFVVKFLKGDLFTGTIWGDMGMKPPKAQS